MKISKKRPKFHFFLPEIEIKMTPLLVLLFCRAVTANMKCTKKRDARAKLLFWLLNLLLFLTILLPSPSSDLKRPCLPLNDGEEDTLGY